VSVLIGAVPASSVEKKRSVIVIAVDGGGGGGGDGNRLVCTTDLAEVCETLAPEVWITVKRARREADAALEEQYAVYDRLLIGNHPL